MKLSVPFIPDKTFAAFLAKNIRHIESVYFPLYEGPLLDARMRFHRADLARMVLMLKSLGPVKKYLLLNSRFITPSLYNDGQFLARTVGALEKLKKDTGLTGIVFADAYLLYALTGFGRDISATLEAVPGINCMLDTGAKAHAFLDLIENSGFTRPGKLIVDRSLNRNIAGLKTMNVELKQKYPELKIELLVNEGCIAHCPFKPAHDALISHANTGAPGTDLYRLNQKLGCHPYFRDHPHNFLNSPFIRPEDTGAYEGFADTIKLCGRTLGVNFLITCIQAYISGSFEGNLLNLMDAARWMADIYHIDNKKLGPGFFKQVTGCTKDCKHCSICLDFFSKTAKRKTAGFKQYKDYL